jgi:23S rRNA (uracil1939-C5)-methyltransferase
MRQVEIVIEKLANGGAGFGRCDGKACFVPYTAPGDIARICTTSEKSSYAEGELIELITPSNLRIKPPCPVFGVCGGCNWQHVEYSSQLREKHQIFTDLLWRSARIPPESVMPVLPAPVPYGYRSRVQLKVHRLAGKIQLGFYRPKSHQVIDIPGQCAISHKNINEVIERLRPLLDGCPDAANLHQLDVARGDDERISIVFNYTGGSINALSHYLLQWKAHQDQIGSLFIRHKKGTSKIFGDDQLSYRIPENTVPKLAELTLSFSQGAFSQVNYEQNLQLIQVVAEFAALSGKEKVLDLYCGNGNFSLPLAHQAAQVFGYEGFRPSLLDAKKNTARNGVSNAFYHCSDAAEAVKKLAVAGETFHVVVLDPPRGGAAETVPHLKALEAEKIVYVSCDPATLARDLKILKNNGFEVKKCQGVDMFPQTYHLESVTLLTRV